MAMAFEGQEQVIRGLVSFECLLNSTICTKMPPACYCIKQYNQGTDSTDPTLPLQMLHGVLLYDLTIKFGIIFS